MESLSVPRNARPSSPRGIVLLIGHLEGGGAERQCYLLARGLRAAGLDVAVLTENIAGPTAEYAAAGVEIELLRGGPEGGSLASKVRRTLRSFSRLREAVTRRRPLLVQAFLPRSNCAASLVRRSAGVPIVIASHRYAGSATWNYDVGQAFEAVLCRSADVNLANSAQVAEHLRRNLRLPPRTIQVVPNGVEPLASEVCFSERLRTRRQLGLKDGDLALVKVANLWPYKGHRDLVAALARVRDAGVAAHAFFVGGDRGSQPALEQEISRLGLSDRIRFLGERRDVCALLAAFDVYVSASRGEGMSNAVMEAMQHGLPIVASRVGGTAELLDDGKAGIIFEPGDVAGLADGILRLARDRQRRIELGLAARSRVAEEFSERAMVRRSLEVYAGAARRRRMDGPAADFAAAAERMRAWPSPSRLPAAATPP